MPRPDRVLFVCTNVRPPDGKESCGGHNRSAELAAALRREVKERGLKGPLRVSTTSCLGPCDGGAHRICTLPDCAQRHFPRTDPAVIMLVEDLSDERGITFAPPSSSTATNRTIDPFES